MAKYCPLKEGPALYLDCMECEEKACLNQEKSLVKETAYKDKINKKGSEQKQ